MAANEELDFDPDAYRLFHTFETGNELALLAFYFCNYKRAAF